MAGILDDFPRGVEEGRLRTANKTPEARWLGVPYQIRELCDPKEWAGVRL